jgi:hypothetical protein
MRSGIAPEMVTLRGPIVFFLMRDLLSLPFHVAAKRRSTNGANF